MDMRDIDIRVIIFVATWVQFITDLKQLKICSDFNVTFDMSQYITVFTLNLH